MNKLLIAIDFAKKKYNGKFRKFNNRPAISHPARVVAHAMLYEDITEQELCVGWLHDTIEDYKVKPNQIVNLFDIDKKFGQEVADLVVELTNPSKKLPKKTPREEKKRVDREHLKLVSFKAKRLKLIDRLDNCLELDSAPQNFINLYVEETRLLLDVIGDAEPELNNQILNQLNLIEHKSRINNATKKINEFMQ